MSPALHPRQGSAPNESDRGKGMGWKGGRGGIREPCGSCACTRNRHGTLRIHCAPIANPACHLNHRVEQNRDREIAHAPALQSMGSGLWPEAEAEDDQGPDLNFRTGLPSGTDRNQSVEPAASQGKRRPEGTLKYLRPGEDNLDFGPLLPGIRSPGSAPPLPRLSVTQPTSLFLNATLPNVGKAFCSGGQNNYPEQRPKIPQRGQRSSEELRTDEHKRILLAFAAEGVRMDDRRNEELDAYLRVNPDSALRSIRSPRRMSQGSPQSVDMDEVTYADHSLRY